MECKNHAETRHDEEKFTRCSSFIGKIMIKLQAQHADVYFKQVPSLNAMKMISTAYI